ncbi:hypothetical protein ACB098_01G014100 [Castanea mollissima]
MTYIWFLPLMWLMEWLNLDRWTPAIKEETVFFCWIKEETVLIYNFTGKNRNKEYLERQFLKLENQTKSPLRKSFPNLDFDDKWTSQSFDFAMDSIYKDCIVIHHIRKY